MPKIRTGESRQKWMQRCIPEVIREGKTPDQAAGQCAGMWSNRNKSKGSK